MAGEKGCMCTCWKSEAKQPGRCVCVCVCVAKQKALLSPPHLPRERHPQRLGQRVDALLVQAVRYRFLLVQLDLLRVVERRVILGVVLGLQLQSRRERREGGGGLSERKTRGRCGEERATAQPSALEPSTQPIILTAPALQQAARTLVVPPSGVSGRGAPPASDARAPSVSSGMGVAEALTAGAAAGFETSPMGGRPIFSRHLHKHVSERGEDSWAWSAAAQSHAPSASS